MINSAFGLFLSSSANLILQSLAFSFLQKLMQQAWEYEKEGMGLQYNYGQQAADAEYKRNLQMWKDTNFGAQRDEMEKARNIVTGKQIGRASCRERV